MHEVRRLTGRDAAIYRAVRLQGLRDHPEAFGSTHEREAALSLADVAARIKASATFGAFLGEALAGVLSIIVGDGPKVRHKGLVVGVYVRPSARGGGVGDALMHAAIEDARSRLERLQLGVAIDNLPARRLYERCGFEPYGFEAHAFKQADGGYIDEILMVRRLS